MPDRSGNASGTVFKFREADLSGAPSTKTAEPPDVVLNFRYNPANMIQDAKKWNVGISLFSSFMQHLPTSPDEDQVEQYHGIVKILEEASGEDFSHFKIPIEKLAPQITSATRGGYGGSPGSATYSKKKYCDNSYFRSQVHGLADYIGTMRVNSSGKAANPYESMTDNQLIAMLADRNIKPKRVPGGNPEYVHDRSYAIAALLSYDNPPAPTHSTVINMHGSNLNFQSPGASITQTSDFKSDDFRKLIESMKQFASTQDLPPEGREQIDIDIGTIEVQTNSQRPSPSIIRECLASIKAILENAAGGVIASGILLQLQRYLS
jgi:hypothetical protein